MLQLSCVGTAYLGLDQHPQSRAWLAQGLDLYGLHYGGSRLAPHAPSVYMAAEHWLAEWTGAPAALLVSSGTVAAQLAVRSLADRYALWQLPLAHPALHWPVRRVITKVATPLPSQSPVAILTDSIDPIRVQAANWEWLASADGAAHCLLVDDSHQLGISGPNGGGSWQSLRQRWAGELVVTASLGKALSTPAGVVLGSRTFIDRLLADAFFGGASPPTPAFIHALLQSKALLAQQLAYLRQLLARIVEAVEPLAGLVYLPDYPVLRITDEQLVAYLQANGVQLSSFSYPRPTDPVVHRLVISAGHHRAEIDHLIALLRAYAA